APGPARSTGPSAANPMSLDPLLLDLLACPIDKQPLLYLAECEVLYNPRLRRSYRIRDGIPVMLADQGETVTGERHRNLLRRARHDRALVPVHVTRRPKASRSADRHLSAQRVQPAYRGIDQLLRRVGQRRYPGPPGWHRGGVLADRHPADHVSGLRHQYRTG